MLNRNLSETEKFSGHLGIHYMQYLLLFQLAPFSFKGNLSQLKKHNFNNGPERYLPNFSFCRTLLGSKILIKTLKHNYRPKI
jgi:hypothetical protein